MAIGSRAGRAAALCGAIAAQICAGPPPRASNWLVWLGGAPARRLPPQSAEARALAAAAPFALARVPRWFERMGGRPAAIGEAALLAASFDVVGDDRAAGRIQALLERGRFQEAAQLAAASGAATPLAPDPHLIASAAIAALARRPHGYLSPWLTYALLGLRGVMPLALRPLWQAAFGWRSPWAKRLTNAEPVPIVRTLTNGSAAAATIVVAPLLGASASATLQAVEDDQYEPELAAMAGLLDRSLTVDGAIVNPQAPPAGPEDIRRARRAAWAIAGAAVAGALALVWLAGPLRRLDLPGLR